MPNEFGAITGPEKKELTTKIAWALGTSFQEPYYGKSNRWWLLAVRMVDTLCMRPELLLSSRASPVSSDKKD